MKTAHYLLPLASFLFLHLLGCGSESSNEAGSDDSGVGAGGAAASAGGAPGGSNAGGHAGGLDTGGNDAGGNNAGGAQQITGCTPTPWSTEVIADPGAMPDLAVGPDGAVHIGFRQPTGNGSKLSHAQLPATAADWQTTAVDTNGNTGLSPSLAIDAAGAIHLAYSSNSGLLRYAYGDGSGNWITETVDSDVEATSVPCALAVDSQGGAHVAYQLYGKIRYGYRPAQGGWTTKVLEEENIFGAIDVLVDSYDRIHIAYSYFGGKGYHLRHAQRLVTEASWTIESVAQGDLGMNGVAVAVDSTQQVHLSFFNFGIHSEQGWVGAVRYAVRSADGTWTLSVVDEADAPGMGLDFVLDHNDHAHLGYYVLDTFEVRYATGTPSSGWTKTTMGTNTTTGYGGLTTVGLDTDPSGGIHFTYYHLGAGHLLYGYTCP